MKDRGIRRMLMVVQHQFEPHKTHLVWNQIWSKTWRRRLKIHLMGHCAYLDLQVCEIISGTSINAWFQIWVVFFSYKNAHTQMWQKVCFTFSHLTTLSNSFHLFQFVLQLKILVQPERTITRNYTYFKDWLSTSNRDWGRGDYISPLLTFRAEGIG